MIKTGQMFNIVHERRVEGSVQSGPYLCTFTTKEHAYYYNEEGHLRFREQLDCVSTGDTPEINRIEFVGHMGREFARYAKEGDVFSVSVQDDGRTIKIFEHKKET